MTAFPVYVRPEVRVTLRTSKSWYIAISRSRVYSGMYVHYRDGIVVEDGGNVFRRELVGGIADEQARLTDGTVTDDDTPAAN